MKGPFEFYVVAIKSYSVSLKGASSRDTLFVRYCTTSLKQQVETTDSSIVIGITPNKGELLSCYGEKLAFLVICYILRPIQIANLNFATL